MKTTSNKGFSYKGTHWTQRPENKERVAALAVKRAQLKSRSKAEKVVAREVKKRPGKVKSDEATIVLNGWQVTLTVHGIKIEKS